MREMQNFKTSNTHSYSSEEIEASKQSSHLLTPRLSAASSPLEKQEESAAYSPSKTFYEQDSNIEQPFSWNEFEEKLYSIEAKLKNCSEMGFAYIVCKRCGEIAVQKKKGKVIVRLSCLLGYCKNDECIKNRKRIVEAALYSYGIKTERLYHFSIGFEPVPIITNEIRLECDRAAKQFMHSLQLLVPQAYFIMYRDINKSKDGKKRLHYHVLSFGWKGIRKPGDSVKIVEKNLTASSQLALNVQLIGYRDTDNLFRYATKRVSGVFGHNGKAKRFYYADIMSLREYVSTFYRKRRLWFYLKNFRPRRTELINVLVGETGKCVYCGHKSFKLVPKENYHKPPGRICPECGLSVSPREYSFELGLCLWCANKYSAAYHMQQKIKAFEKFLEAKGK